MRYSKITYVALVLLVGIGGVAASLLYPQEELLIVSLAQVALATLTFPLGCGATVIGALIILAGLVSPLESLTLMTPVYAVLGYIQWWRLFRALYRPRP